MECITGDVPGKDGATGVGKRNEDIAQLARGRPLEPSEARCRVEARKLMYRELTATQIIGGSLCPDPEVCSSFD